MGFMIKDFASIAASMINWMRAGQKVITDFRPGAVARTILEAAAQEIDELYQQMFIGIRQAIPVATYSTFDFPLLEPTASVGFIRVTITPISDDTAIPTGAVFGRALGGNVQYPSTADILIPAGDTYADVPVVADSAGSQGNIASGTAFTISPQPLPFLSAVALGAITGGTDGETETQRKARFKEFIKTLERSTDRALVYGASLAVLRNEAGVIVERVASAKAVTPYRDVDPLLYTPGLVWLYIENRTGAPSDDLKNRCQAIIDGYMDGAVEVPGWKAAGCQVVVKVATRTTVAVTATLAALPGYAADDLIVLAEAETAAYLSELTIAQPFFLAELIRRVMAIEGVLNFVPTVPSADVIADSIEKLAPGTIAITAA